MVADYTFCILSKNCATFMNFELLTRFYATSLIANHFADFLKSI